MPALDLERERRKLDRLITYFHFGRARRKIRKCLRLSRARDLAFYAEYFAAQEKILDGKLRHALLYLEEARRLRPDDGCTWNDIALCCAEMGHYRQALNRFDEGLRRDPNCATLYHNKGWLLHTRGKYRGAALCFHKALELEEDREETLFSLGDTYVRLGNPRRAEKFFHAARRRLKGKSAAMYRETLRRLRALTE
ncbi:MAG: tetratricopeptide repeat protein [Candidatus Omnitrophica bacterium]|nr:tetratricopeptide repeat protein [Candidatus Omnitrophota bacterium]